MNFGRKISSGALLISIGLMSMPFAFAQTLPVPTNTVSPASTTRSNVAFLIRVEPVEEDQANPGEIRAARKIAGVLSRTNAKNGILIDDAMVSRESVLSLAANELADGVKHKVLYRVDWANLFSRTATEAALNRAIDDILKFAGDPRSGNILYLDDASGFSTSNPLFSRLVAEKLYDAIAKSRLQVFTAASKEQFTFSITNDPVLRPIFEKIEVAADNDGFLGDKLSPDLRNLANTEPNARVKVILQADDINNGSLRKVLSANGVRIESKAEILDMMVLDLPVRVAEAVADARGARHLSLDRQMNVLGHVETTTGTSLVRTIQQGLSVSLLGTGVVNTSAELNGAGIGIAIVDSGIRESHRSFTS